MRLRSVNCAWLRADWSRSAPLVEMHDALKRAGISIETKSTDQLDRLGSGNQGIALEMRDSPAVDWAALEGAGSSTVLILDGIEDPQNLGSVLRTSWLMNVSAIFAPADRAVGLTPAACKVASGGTEHVAFEAHVSFGPVIKRLKDAGFWIYALSEKGSAHPWDLALPEKVAWVVGAEGSGLRVATERACDELIRIPQVDSGSSYNAAIAAAMALFETARQRQSSAAPNGRARK